jgi:hypothetical protein
MTPKRTLLSRLLILLSLALFAASLFYPALLFKDHSPVIGGEVLGWGWWGFMTGNFAWMANPVFLLCLILLWKREIGLARLFTACAIALGLHSYAATEWWFNEGFGTPILGLGTALYIWMSSLVVLLLASLAAVAPAKVVEQGEAQEQAQ